MFGEFSAVGGGAVVRVSLLAEEVRDVEGLGSPRDSAMGLSVLECTVLMSSAIWLTNTGLRWASTMLRGRGAGR